MPAARTWNYAVISGAGEQVLGLELGATPAALAPGAIWHRVDDFFGPGQRLVFKGRAMVVIPAPCGSLRNFAPRIGVAYKLDDKTVLRGGWGVFYNLFDRVGSEDQLALNLPGLVNKTITQTSGSPVFFLQQGFPAGFLNTPNLDPAAGQLRAVRLRAVGQDDPSTTTNQASAGVQRELAGSMVLSADFIYSRGSNLATLVNLNQPLPNAAGNNALGALPYPNFGFVEWRADNGRSEYKGVDLGLEKRFTRGYAFGLAYTLGKSQDNSSEQLTTQGSNAFPQNARDFDSWYGRATTTSATASARTSSGGCRSGTTSSHAAGPSPASTPRTPAIRSPSIRATTTWART